MAPTPIFKKVKKRKPAVVYVEPKRKNLFDVLTENMLLASRNIFIHRLIYVGRHTFNQDKTGSISSYFKAVVDTVNADYCDECLTGYFLYYPRYFCHVIEGSEITLKKHLDLIFNSEEISDNIEKVKVLVVYHHINQRFLNYWTELTAKPPTLLEKIDITTDLPNATAKVVICINKLYKLGLYLRVPGDNRSVSEATDIDNLRPFNNRSIGNIKSTISSFEEIGRPSDALPEYNLLEFLMESEYIRDLKEYADAFGSIPSVHKYEDYSWPAQVDYVPRNIFDSEFDPVTDLPSKEQEIDPDLI